ncbi:MAG: darcynin family protein [Marinomonas sp.]
MRLFDAEAFSAYCSDVVMFETTNIRDYYFAIEEMRDSKLYTVPYFDVVSIILAIENGFIEFEKAALT